MQWCKVITLFDCCDNFVIDNNGGSELFAAVYYSVAYCTDFVKRLDYAVVSIG